MEPKKTVIAAVFVFLLLFPFLIGNAQANTEVYLFRLQMNGDSVRLSDPRNISNNEGYDNQPSFYDENSVLFAATRDGQTDILKFNIKEGSTSSWVSDTPTGSEYSPLRIPATDEVSAIRLDIDGLQRLYRYNTDNGTSELLVPKMKIGYQLWYTPDILVFTVLSQDKMDLWMTDFTKGTSKMLQKNVGRSLQKIPNTNLISYTSATDPVLELRSIDPISGKTSTITDLKDIQDVCWLPDGSLVAGKGKRIYRMIISENAEWEPLQTFTDTNINAISRIAVNTSGTRLAFVAETSPETIVQKQLDAYNRRDIDAFVATFSDDVAVYEFPNELRYTGVAELRNRYSAFFEKTGNLHSKIVKRIVIGNKVIDEEEVTANDAIFKVVAVYEVAEGRIHKMTFIR